MKAILKISTTTHKNKPDTIHLIINKLVTPINKKQLRTIIKQHNLKEEITLHGKIYS